MANIKLFENKKIRSVWNEADQKWYFSVQDVIEILTDSNDVKQYIKRMRSRDPQLNSNWGTICTPLEMVAADEKIISNRIAEYNKKTAPLADYYQKQEKFTSINGTGTVDDIFKNLCSTIEKVMC